MSVRWGVGGELQCWCRAGVSLRRLVLRRWGGAAIMCALTWGFIRGAFACHPAAVAATVGAGWRCRCSDGVREDVGAMGWGAGWETTEYVLRGHQLMRMGHLQSDLIWTIQYDSNFVALVNNRFERFWETNIWCFIQRPDFHSDTFSQFRF